MKQHGEMILVGRVAGLFGVRGWVKLRSDTDPRENILGYSPLYLERRDEHGTRWQAFEITGGKRQGKSIIAHLGDCPDRDAAALLVGARIAIRPEQLPETEEGEYYWRDLIGLRVATEDGVELGEIRQMMETGANDVMVVRGEEKRERLIPFLQGEVIKSIDLEQGCMVVDWDPDF